MNGPYVSELYTLKNSRFYVIYILLTFKKNQNPKITWLSKGAVQAICLDHDVPGRPKSVMLERAGLQEAAEELQPG